MGQGGPRAFCGALPLLQAAMRYAMNRGVGTGAFRRTAPLRPTGTIKGGSVRRSTSLAAWAALLCASAAAAGAQTASPTHPTGPATNRSLTQRHAMPDPSNGGGKEPPPTASTNAYKAAADQMHMDMAVRYTGDADKDFASTMAAHHKGAIDMANIQLKYGKDPELRKLAQEIIAAQEKEIAQMNAWLAKH